FLAQKAKIITDIELFYLLPNQHHWKEWFPDILYLKKTREIDDGKGDPGFLKFISEELRKTADIPKPGGGKIDKNDLEEIEKKLENKLNHNNEQMLIQMQTLLNEIKNLKKLLL
ncbi:2594_t:CDS:2, partial [Entrophospora sp. SA101]